MPNEQTEDQATEDKSSGLSAMEKLRAARKLAKSGEMRELDGRRFDLEEIVGSQGDEGQSKLQSYLKNLTPRRIIVGASLIIGVPAVVSIAFVVYTALIPSMLLSDYEDALAEGDLVAANQAMSQYLSIESEDWERMAEHGQSLLVQGEFGAARNQYAKLISRSPLSNDFDIQFLSAMSYLPRLNTTKGKMSEALVSNDTYIPALVARSLLENTKLDVATADIDTAIGEYQNLRRDGEAYKRYQEFVALFLVNLCRTDDPFQAVLSPAFDLYPTNLRGNELFVYGLDTNFNLDLCVVVPDNVADFTADLGVMLYAFKTFIAIQSEDYEAAIQSIAQSTSIQTIPFNSYIDALLLSFTGDFQKAESAFLRTGLDTAPEVVISQSIAKMLHGPEHWADAATQLDTVLREQPENPQALNNRAVNSMLNGRYGQAKSDLDQALAARNFYVHAVYNLAIVLLLGGDPEGAINRFNTLSGNEEIFPGIEYYVALAYSNLGEEEKAVNLWRLSVANPGYSALANLALGDVYAREEIGYDTAINHYRTAFSIDSENYEAALKLARMQALLGNSDEALEEIEEIESTLAAEEQRNVEFFKELAVAIKGEILFLKNDFRTSDVLAEAFENTKDLTLYKKVTEMYTLQLIKEEKLREALDVTRIALPTEPTDVTLLLSRARALAAFNDIPEALEIINDAERLHPENTNLMDAKASVLAKDQRWEQAVEVYEKIFELKPSSLDPIGKAIALLERVDPENPKLETLRQSYERASYSPEAELLTPEQRQSIVIDEAEVARIKNEITELSTYIEDGTVEKFSGHMYRGYLYSQIGNTTEAINDFLEATKFTDEEPDKAYQPWQNLANSYILTAQFQEALGSLDNAVSRNPPEDDLIPIILSRAGVKERLGQVEEAITDYDTVTEQVPNYTLPYMRRAFLYVGANNPQSAIEELNVVISIEPENLEAYRARYNAYSMLGDTDNASKDAKSIQLLEEKQRSQ